MQCKICKFAVTSFHFEESTHQKEKQPRDLSDARQKSRELTTPPEPPKRVDVRIACMRASTYACVCSLYISLLHSGNFCFFASRAAKVCVCDSVNVCMHTRAYMYANVYASAHEFILHFCHLMPTICVPFLAEAEESRRRDEAQRAASTSLDDTEFPNKRRNMILGAIFAATAMAGYAFASGLIRLHMLDYQPFRSTQDQENANNSAEPTSQPQPPDFSASGFDPLFEEQRNNEGGE